MKAACLTPLLVGFVILCTSSRAWALGEEQFGNEPLSEANYAKWPGLAAVVNDKARAYYNWVNGNENCYYVGSVEELNAAIQKYAAAELKAHEVVLLPGTGKVRSFHETEFTYLWHLQIFDGIAGHLTTLDKGDLVWNKHPRLTIQVTDEIDLAKLEIPKNVKLLDVTELSARARQGIGSTDKSVRGWCAGVIAHLDSFDSKNQAAVESLLIDDDDWVRLNASGSISLFGAQAKSALPALKTCLESKDENLKSSAQKAIETIEAAKEDAEAKGKHAATVERIKKFVAANQPAKP